MRWALIAVFGLAAVGAWAMGFTSAGALPQKIEPMQLPRVAMRPLPELGKAAVAAPAKPAAAADPTPEDAPLPVAKPTPAPPPAPVAAKEKEPAKPAPAPAPAPAPVREREVARPAPAPKPVVVAAAKPAPEDAPPPAPKPAPKPAPEENTPAPAAAAAAPAGSGDGLLNLKASDTAEIVVDGRKVGPSPKLGYKVKAGKHKIRFDCYDENGNLKPGKVQTVEVQADAEQEVSYDCPFTQ